MGKTLVLIGLGIAALGLLVMLGVPLGRLPGRLSRCGAATSSFYFPLATSIVLSILLTLHARAASETDHDDQSRHAGSSAWRASTR